MENETLGEVIRRNRLKLRLSLRSFATDLDISPSYLSDIENDRRVPAEDILRQIADRLGLDSDELLGLAGRLGDNAERFLRRTPSATVLFRRLAQSGWSDEQIRRELLPRLADPKDGGEP